MDRWEKHQKIGEFGRGAKAALKKILISLTYVKIPYLEDFDFLRKSYRTEVLTISSQEKQKSFYKCYNIKITFLSPFFA